MLRAPRLLMTREREAHAARMATMSQEIRDGLRSTLAGIVKSLADMLAVQPDGSRPTIYANRLDKLREFFTTFATMNVTQDGELAELVEQASMLMGDIAPDELKRDASVLEVISTSADGLANALAGMIAPDSSAARASAVLDEMSVSPGGA